MMASTTTNERGLYLEYPSRITCRPEEYVPEQQIQTTDVEDALRTARSWSACGWVLTTVVFGVLMLFGLMSSLALPKSELHEVALWTLAITGLTSVLTGFWSWFASKRSAWVLTMGITLFYVWAYLLVILSVIAKLWVAFAK